MRVVRSAEQREMPWKNGGGFTRELLVHPPGAGLEDFEVRLSRASVVADGPFSPFPGVDRWICVIEGAGMDLRGDGEVLRLEPGKFVRFSGDARFEGHLRAGPVGDLNLMLRRPWRAEPVWGALGGWVASVPTLVWVTEGALVGPRELALGAGDAAWLETGEGLVGEARGLIARLGSAPPGMC